MLSFLLGSLAAMAGTLQVDVLDIGQGDATLVIAPGGETLLIDGGPAGSLPELRAALETHAAGRLDAVVVSHFDADHLAGFIESMSGEQWKYLSEHVPAAIADSEPAEFDRYRPISVDDLSGAVRDHAN